MTETTITPAALNGVPRWYLTKVDDENADHITRLGPFTHRLLVGKPARRLVPTLIAKVTDILQTAEGQAILQEIQQFLAGRTWEGDSEGQSMAENFEKFRTILPLIAHAAHVIQPLQTFLEDEALYILTTVPRGTLDNAGTPQEVIKMAIEVIMYHWEAETKQGTSRTEVQAALEKSINDPQADPSFVENTQPN